MKRTFLTLVYLLLSVSIFSQPPDGYYDNAQGLTGEQLKAALHNIIDDHVEKSYDFLWTILPESDEDPNNTNNFILLYTGRSISKSSSYPDYNREHVWAKSHGDFGTSAPAGTDAHHLRPTDVSVNSDRGNKDFDNGGTQHSEATGCYYTESTWEPRDAVKGDVARMMFYMAVRYEGDVSGEPDLELVDYITYPTTSPIFGKLSTLLQWHIDDPVDDIERHRNDVVYSYQENRNPFIDHPEYVDYIWGSGTVTEYTITASAGANGSISPSGNVTVNQGQSKTFTITPNTGYHVNVVTVDGSSVGAVTSYTFNNVTANHTINATFAINTYTITASAGANGSISPSGNVEVTHGQNKTFTITPSANYHIENVLVNGSSVGAVSTYTFSNVTSNQTISATFAINTYTITASAGSNGSITPSGNVVVNHGANQTFTIEANENYVIESLTVDGGNVAVSGSSTTYEFTNVTANHSISVAFALEVHTISSSASTFGTISPSGDVEVSHGSNQTFTITPDASCYVTNVLVDGSSVGLVESYTFSNVTTDHTIEAQFSDNPPPTYTITATAGENGSISPSGEVSVTENNNQNFTITPNANYHVLDVLVDGESIGDIASYTFSTVNANHTIHATFAINTHVISASANEYGTISPSGEVEVEHGSNQTFTITPNEGCTISQVLVDEVDAGELSTYTFENITGNHTIEAVFSVNSYTITATANENGSISPSGEVDVNYGSSQLFTITPNEGYSVSDVLVDEVSVGAVETYTFENISSNHTIEASFEIKTYTITASANEFGTITPNGEVEVEHGGSQTFTITPNEGYLIVDVHVNDVSVGAVSTYTFENVTENQTIVANFSTNAFVISASAGENGTISPSGEVAVGTGDDITFSIIPNDGYKVSEVLVDDVSVGTIESYTFENVTTNHSIEATFEIQRVTLTLEIIGEGSVKVNGESYVSPIEVDYGTSLSLDAFPEEYWNFDSWSGDQGGRDAHIEVSMNGNKTITATFTEITDQEFTLTINVIGSGVVEVNNATYTEPTVYNRGSELTLSAIAAEGWQFDSWNGDLNGRETPITLTMNNHKVVNVTFEEYTDVIPTYSESIVIYPNPFSQSVTIKNAENIVHLRLSNLIGQKLLEHDYHGSHSITLESNTLPKGVYLIVMYFNNGESAVRKVVKE